jgi:hypothetical protein
MELQLKTKLQHTEIWSASPWSPQNHCYLLAAFFRYPHLNELSFLEENFGASLKMLFQFLLFLKLRAWDCVIEISRVVYFLHRCGVMDWEEWGRRQQWTSLKYILCVENLRNRMVSLLTGSRNFKNSIGTFGCVWALETCLIQSEPSAMTLLIDLSRITGTKRKDIMV